MPESFPRGTIVYLNSGSPPLTVLGDSAAEGHVVVGWVGDDDIQRSSFPVEALTEKVVRPMGRP
jgi:uncharacterized protein YodC (DUF2158 family)